jgi:hypothetical protein
MAIRQTAKLLLAAVLLAGTPAMAQEVDEATRAAARQIGREGLEAYKQGQYEDALEKLNRAYDVVKAPTLGLWTARTMVQLGMLVEASERYVEVSRLEVSGGDTALQEEAKKVATEEREALLPRIPQLKLVVEGAAPDQVQVQLDGKDVPASLLGLQRPVNPGVRKAVGKCGDETVTEEATLAEGENKSLVLRFSPAPATAAAPPASATTTAPATALAPTQPTADGGTSPGSAQRTAGWVSLGIGGVGVVVGGVSGAIVLSTKSKLDSSEECVKQACGPVEYDNVDRLNSMRTVSTVGFVTGGVGLAAGLTLLLTTPKARETAQPQVAPWIGFGSAGVSGRF